jgi:hypothetical protein
MHPLFAGGFDEFDRGTRAGHTKDVFNTGIGQQLGNDIGICDHRATPFLL